MITEKPMYIKKQEALKQLIDILEPIAAKYKAIHKANEALKAAGWWISNADNTRLCTRIPHIDNRSEFFEVYHYGEKYTTLQGILELVKSEYTKYCENYEVRLYTSDLGKFVCNAVGTEVECTRAEFIERKKLTLDALKRAVDFVESLDDLQSPNHYQFDESEK